MRLLLFFIVTQAFSEKFIWDGDEYTFYASRKAGTFDDKYIDKKEVNIENKKISKFIDIIPHMRLQNVRILQLNITSYVPGEIGIWISGSDKSKYNQIFGQGHQEKIYFFKNSYSTCQLMHCEAGLYLLHESAEADFIEKKITDFYGAFYIKFITTDMYFKLDKFYIYGDEFPLIICPYKRWTSPYSATEFEPLQKSGLVFDKFLERQIMLPGYQTDDDSNIFICGYLKYMDDTKLTIGQEIIPVTKSNFTIKITDDPNDIWICEPNHSPSQYIYFAYSKNLQGYNKMRYINYNSLKENYLYYDETLYLYDYNDDVINSLKSNGVKHSNKMNSTKPVCANKLSPRKAKVILVSGDDTEILNGNKSIETLYIKEDMLNKENSFKCKIVVEGAEQNPYLSKYYNREIETSLISLDEYGNKIVHKQIVFKNNLNGFGTYKCEIKSKSKKFDDIHFINSLTFETLPKAPSITNIHESWQTIYDVIIQCPKKILNIGTLKDMIVEVSDELKYKITKKANKSLFYEENNFERLRHQDLITKNIVFLNATTECIYKTPNKMVFLMTKNGVILEKEFIKFKRHVQDKSNYIISSLISVGIIALAFIISILILLFVKKMRKSRKMKKLDKTKLNDQPPKSLSIQSIHIPKNNNVSKNDITSISTPTKNQQNELVIKAF